MRVIVINSGSSSIKYESFESPNAVPATGLLVRTGCSERSALGKGAAGAHRHIGQQAEAPMAHTLRPLGGDNGTRAIADHREGFSLVLEVSTRARAGATPEAVFGVGHRVVHGGGGSRSR